MREYYLPRYVFVSFLDESCIWLDTRIDKFLSTSREECQCLSELVEGWPVAEPGHFHADSTQGAAREVAESLLRQGLLTRGRNGKSAAPPRLKSPSRSVTNCGILPIICWHHRASFFTAWLLTILTFKLGSLQLALSTLEKRKAMSGRRSTDEKLEKTCGLVHVFMRFRSHFYSAKGECLFDSFALANFLAWYRRFPAFVIAVSEAPFFAHGYLQEDDMVLNDDADHVKEFQPVAVF
jgi:Transglutaminase-like superfamily